MEFDGIEVDEATLDLLRENFYKFLPPDAPGDACDRLDPGFMKKKYEDCGLDQEVPAMYAMISWMNEEYINNGQTGIGLSFDDFIQQAMFYFSSQKNTSKGLEEIFSIMDGAENNGLSWDFFNELCDIAKIKLDANQRKVVFDKGSKDGIRITSEDFTRVMQLEAMNLLAKNKDDKYMEKYKAINCKAFIPKNIKRI